MRRDVLFSTMLAPSVLLWSATSWSGAYQAEASSLLDASENLCRADEIASFAPPAGEPSENPTRERVFGGPLRGALHKSVIDAATELLDYPMGTELIIEVNGTPYGFRLEPHYHPPGYEGGPIGWHKGVTVYEIEERESF